MKQLTNTQCLLDNPSSSVRDALQKITDGTHLLYTSVNIFVPGEKKCDCSFDSENNRQDN